MQKGYKQMTRELLASKGFEVVSITNLPDRKSFHTTAYHIGFAGSIGGKSWEDAYWKIRKELEQC